MRPRIYFKMNYIDTETFCEVPIKNGTYIYTSNCECMIVTYAFGDGPAQLWDRTVNPEMPYDLEYVLNDPDELWTAHGAMFDRNVLKYALKVEVPISRWRCTIAKGYAHGLPGGLDIQCQVLNVPQDLAKHKDGKRLVHLFTKPIPFKHSLKKQNYPTAKAYKAAVDAARAAWPGRATRLTHPEDWELFCEYARADITAMREVDRKMPSWNYRGAELALWHLDQKINDRGMQMDTDLARAAIAAVDVEQKALATRTQELTRYDEAAGEGVKSTTQVQVLAQHVLREYGIDLPDMQMATLERRINDPGIPDELKELLRVRLAASSNSTSKYQALLKGVMPDGRLRGTLQFNGAARTRRYAGRMFQPQNMPRPDMKYADIDFAIRATLAGVADMLTDDFMRWARNMIRGTLVAPKGRKLIAADFSNIEGRAAAWLAGEDWKLQAYKDYDDGIGPDLYLLAYARAFNIDWHDINTNTVEGYLQRQIGKVKELMLQYQGGVGAFATGAAAYRINLQKMADSVADSIPDQVMYEARGMWDWTVKKKRNTFGLTEHVFTVCDSLKRLWRIANSNITSSWPEFEEAARNAIDSHGKAFTARRLKFQRDGSWLRVQLPSGNYLCYPAPQVDDSGKISYMGMNQYTHKWSRISTYGGKILENATQSFAGDLLKAPMPACEGQGYETVLTVHDEIVAEADDNDRYTADGLSRIMIESNAQYEGLPLAAKGFETYRYRKDD